MILVAYQAYGGSPPQFHQLTPLNNMLYGLLYLNMYTKGRDSAHCQLAISIGKGQIYATLLERLYDR